MVNVKYDLLSEGFPALGADFSVFFFAFHIFSFELMMNVSRMQRKVKARHTVAINEALIHL